MKSLGIGAINQEVTNKSQTTTTPISGINKSQEPIIPNPDKSLRLSCAIIIPYSLVQIQLLGITMIIFGLRVVLLGVN